MSFRREVECLSLLTPESKKSPNIDHFKGVYNVCNEKESYIALFEEGCCDFCNIPYSEIKKPVSFALTQLISIGEGIASLHRSDLVHRDIKGKNLLVGCGEAPGKVTDFGMLQKCGPKGETHSTACTPFHAAPYIWSNILGQKYRTKSGQRKDEGGFQGKAADIFSLGRTIQYDVINSIIIHLCEKAEVDIKDLVRIFLFPRKFSGHISDKKLMAYETINPGYVFYMERTERQEEYILIFEKETEVYERTLKIIHLLEGCLEDLEYFKLVGLTALARDLQVTNKASLLGSFGLTEENQSDQLIQKVLERLRIIENKYCFRSPDFGRDSSFEEESTLDNGSPKRRKKETPERGEREVSVLAPETPKTELDFEPPKIEGDDF
ncbi:protein kinase domain-containing protein [Candidatus Neptunichlamydia sp. REUL1]|uniref:protein kinase domain-containing protein n=1 Tax=Candidatus Neptunichlamydia sp. REUL1 TaxID=3064277 RepID=UPI00292EC11F|nr:protein kinase [Candidatus Neptunochlamydia sp. REUL1]